MNDSGPGRGDVANAEAATRGIACSFETSSYETSLKIGERDGAYQRRPSVVRTSSCVLKQRGGMRRSGALTLGAVLMLGGVTGGRGDELSGSVGRGQLPSSGGFVLPDAAGELERFAGAADGVRIRRLQQQHLCSSDRDERCRTAMPQGDFTSTSSFGLSTKPNWYGQQFFFDGSFGVIRYLHQVGFNSNIYSFRPGVNWTLTSRCSGTLAALFTKVPLDDHRDSSEPASTMRRDVAQRNRKMRDLQRVFSGFQQQRDEDQQLESARRAE